MYHIKQLGKPEQVTQLQQPSWLYTSGSEKKRLNLIALGDVGQTVAMALKLLGSDCLSTIGVYDINQNAAIRLELELNQIYEPFSYDAFPNVSYDHWSDIDLGGVRIYKMLKKINPSVRPLMMDMNVLLKHQNQSVLIEDSYRSKLVQLLSEEKDPDVTDIIKGILETGLRLEQEHIDVKDVIVLSINE